MAADTTAWPYDADQHHPLTALRVPVIATTHPRWSYLAAVCVDEHRPCPLYNGQNPTEAEGKMIASFIDEYITHWYTPGWQHKLRTERPFPIDGGVNTVTFLKYGDGDWAYCRPTWEHGPVPVYPAVRAEIAKRGEHTGIWTATMSLTALMDHIHTTFGAVSTRWVQWKAAHPDVFPAEAA